MKIKKESIILAGLVFSLLATLYFHFQSLIIQTYVEPFFTQVTIILIVLFGFAFYLEKSSNTKENKTKLINQIFQYVLVIFLLVLLIKEFYPIDAMINVNYLLVVTLFFGILSITSETEEKSKKEKLTKKDLVMIAGAGIIGAALVYLKTTSLGLLGIFISIVAGLLIIILSYLVLTEEDSEKND